MMRGVRGATTVEQNDELEIIQVTEELLQDMIDKNNIQPEDVCSVIISVTDDITATFPARALRNFDGWKYVPVMCFKEISVPHAIEQCIRVMIHWNTTKSQREIEHVYLKQAVHLRPDLRENN